MDGNNNPEKLTLSAVLDSPSPTKKRRFTLVLEVSLTETPDDEKSVAVVSVTASQSPAKKPPPVASTPIVESLPLIVVGREERDCSGIAPQSPLPGPSDAKTAGDEMPIAEPEPLPLDDADELPVDDVESRPTTDAGVEPATQVAPEQPIPTVFQNNKVEDCASEADFRKGLFRQVRARCFSETEASAKSDEFDWDWESDETDSTRDDDPADWTVLTEELERSLSDTANDTFDLVHTFGYSREL